ncbi:MULTISPECIES: ABC transporter substrate-binding protein [unclassified Chelatococcus]|uniref:ABC transporter substrate-binding protein n=1 Tax=unclassified Chelatococcus TaxID=2638111 RepID=UPI001BCD6E75|nr:MULTISPECIES: ABC transporter substrate-binding protein [unclassified Chelatococcus]MBS7695872.1 ABC transporter substrate-binding protein [Chelatococcus sp. YT9]MBX3555753.1 ABC transporter substrate-binding protein [Chelatococcus sp.]
MRRRSILGAAAVAAVLMSFQTMAVAQTKGGDIVIGISQAPPSLDAQITSAQAARNVTLHIFETLYARDENAKPVPELAEGVTISPDGKTYVFPIRKGVKFHNGKELDANDVVASIERYRKIGASPALVSAIESIKATGPHEVTITLKNVQATFLDNLSSPRAPIAIYPASEAAKEAGKIEIIGTGPYKFVEYKPDSHVKIARYDGYSPNPKGTGRDGFAGKKEAFLDTVTFRFMPEAGARTAALESGEIQFNETVDGPTAKRLAEDKRFTVEKVVPFGLQVIKFNQGAAPGNDKNFRLAVQAALNMEDIMSIAYSDIYQMDPSWLYPGSAFYTTAGSDKYNKGDLEAAKALLAKSGYKGEKLTFIVDNLRANIDTATVLQERLKDIGVNVDISVADWPTVSKMGFTPQGWTFWTHGFGIEPYEGPGSVMAPWVNGLSQQAKDPVIDELAIAFNAEMDEGKRKAIFDKFQAHMYDNAVAMKAGNYGVFQASTSKLKNFKPYRIPRMWGVWLEP